MISFFVPTDLQKPHVSNEEEASAIQQLCNQEKRSSHDQEEAEPQWTEEEQMEPDPSPLEEQGKPGPPCIKEEEEDPEPPLIEEQKKKTQCPLMVEEKVEPDSSVLKHEPLEPEHLTSRYNQKDICCSQEGEQLDQNQSISLMETSTLQEEDLSEEEPRTEQLSYHVSPVDETKDQEGISSTVSESRSQTDTKKRSFRSGIGSLTQLV
ncbi:hypothetical protein ATANTOWER_011788 [Ataeniobius toweri]|uniref:Uncharacterized protein n=1 Tax=Ataeniobius toweri TaxID=208326 RepID=A0ABU7AF33_9TELE|nr:hypothetical protein [Ataeniobius toweri]